MVIEYLPVRGYPMNVVKIFRSSLCTVVSTLALLNASKNAALVNKEGIKYPSQLPTETDLFLTKLCTS